MPGMLLTQKEAAAYLGVGRNKVREWTANGRLPAFVDTGSTRVLYPLLGLEEWQREAGRIAAREVPT